MVIIRQERREGASEFDISKGTLCNDYKRTVGALRLDIIYYDIYKIYLPWLVITIDYQNGVYNDIKIYSD